MKASHSSQILFSFSLFILIAGCGNAQTDPSEKALVKKTEKKEMKPDPKPVLDSVAFKKKMIAMANGDSSERWRFKEHYPRPGAILPMSRIIAYYGNLYSTRMGILGELPKPQMFARLKAEVAAWEKADPSTPVVPALHYIVTTAQIDPGASGKYRLRMPNAQIDKVMAMAEEINAIVFLDRNPCFGKIFETSACTSWHRP
jgi:hypothetical protein